VSKTLRRNSILLRKGRKVEKLFESTKKKYLGEGNRESKGAAKKKKAEEKGSEESGRRNLGNSGAKGIGSVEKNELNHG